MLLDILSVNVGKPQSIASKSGLSGIFKVPKTKSVLIGTEGLADDAIVDRQNHGGVDQAVYVYCQRDYDWWHQHEGLVVSPGLFGENLTIGGMSTIDAHIGARLVGERVVLEITSPRMPCKTLGARMQDRSFPKRFWQSHRTGFYCRVIKPGEISAGETMLLQAFTGARVSIYDWITYEPFDKIDAAMRERLLSTPIHHKARAALLK